MFGIHRTFRRLICKDAARAFNSMAAFLTNICGDESVDIDRPDDPSAGNPPCISVNKTWLAKQVKSISGEGAGLSSVGANKLVGTDGTSEPFAAADLPTAKDANLDRALVCVAGGTALSFKSLAAETPTASTTLLAGDSTNAVANTATWTAGGATGVVESELVRVVWTGTYLYGFYRVKTYDKYGRLRSVSAETRVTIDAPVKVTWN